MLSASKVGDLMKCSWQFRPGLDLLADETNEAAATGTYVHALIEAMLNGVCDPVPVPEKANEKRGLAIFDKFSQWWPANNQGLDWQTEVPYALSLTTGAGRVLPSKGQRDYSAAMPDEIPGTIDLFALTPRAVVVWDIKTTLRPEYTDAADVNHQLKTLGLAAARAHGREVVEAALLFANEFDTRLESATFDALDLDIHESELRLAHAGIATSEPRPGPHCRFCVARRACPSVPKQYRVKGKAA
jgi:hypothetical protein